jgi:hypothetical protein
VACQITGNQRGLLTGFKHGMDFDQPDYMSFLPQSVACALGPS